MGVFESELGPQSLHYTSIDSSARHFWKRSRGFWEVLHETGAMMALASL